MSRWRTGIIKLHTHTQRHAYIHKPTRTQIQPLPHTEEEMNGCKNKLRDISEERNLHSGRLKSMYTEKVHV